jgi:hypothetical protein
VATKVNRVLERVEGLSVRGLCIFEFGSTRYQVGYGDGESGAAGRPSRGIRILEANVGSSVRWPPRGLAARGWRRRMSAASMGGSQMDV